MTPRMSVIGASIRVGSVFPPGFKYYPIYGVNYNDQNSANEFVAFYETHPGFPDNVTHMLTLSSVNADFVKLAPRTTGFAAADAKLGGNYYAGSLYSTSPTGSPYSSSGLIDSAWGSTPVDPATPWRFAGAVLQYVAYNAANNIIISTIKDNNPAGAGGVTDLPFDYLEEDFAFMGIVNGVYFLAASNNVLYSSSNCINWTAKVLPHGYDPYWNRDIPLFYMSGQYVFIVQPTYNTNSFKIYKSTDLTTWTSSTISLPSFPSGVASFSTRFYEMKGSMYAAINEADISGDSMGLRTIYSSSDLSTWVRHDVSLPSPISGERQDSLYEGPDGFIICSHSVTTHGIDRAYGSTDLTTWHVIGFTDSAPDLPLGTESGDDLTTESGDLLMEE